MFDFDTELAQRYGGFASYPSDVNPVQVEYYGENPAVEVDRLLDQYATPQSCVLDIGCGAGFTLCRLAPNVKQIVGIDHSEELLQATRQRIERLGLTNASAVFGIVGEPETLQSLPDDSFDLAFSRRGPNLSPYLVRALRPDAILVQELVSNFDGYPVGEIFGRRPYAPYFYTDQPVLVSTYAELGLFPVSCKEYFYEEFFRDREHLEAYLKQIWALLTNWRLSPKPYEATRDGAALDLYVRYNTTPKGVRLLRQRKIFVFRRTTVSYYPVDVEEENNLNHPK